MGFTQQDNSSKKLIYLWLLSVLLSALFYKPIPQGVLEPWKARQAVGLLRFIGALAYVGDLVGIGTFIPNTRNIIDNLSSLQPRYYDGITVEDSYFDGTKVRLYIPQNKDDRRAGILFVHGGGWMICSIETHDHIVSEIARRLNVMVVSVDYRLCPEHPYPAPVQDSLRALLHFMNAAEQYNVDPKRIAIVGDSAGGNMAASLALQLRTMSGTVPQPKLQALVYPILQAVDLRLPSYIQNEGAVIGTAEETALVLLSYMGVNLTFASTMAQNNHTDAEVKEMFYNLVGKYLPSNESVRDRINGVTTSGPSAASSELTELIKDRLLDPFCFPLMQKNLTGLPPTYIATAEHDPLRDDGMLYAKRLEDAGVRVTLNNYMDGFHGTLAFFQYPIKMDVGIRMIDDLILYLDKNL